MTEVGDGTAIYIKPESSVLAIEIINEKLHNPNDLITKLIDNPKRFSMKAIIKSYTSGYNKACKTESD